MHACMLISSIYIVITVYLYTTEIFELCTRQPAAGVWLVFFLMLMYVCQCMRTCTLRLK